MENICHYWKNLTCSIFLFVSDLSGTSPVTPTPKVVRRKASFEGVVKHLTDLAVTISTDDGGQKKLLTANSDIFNGRGRDDDYVIQVCLLLTLDYFWGLFTFQIINAKSNEKFYMLMFLMQIKHILGCLLRAEEP